MHDRVEQSNAYLRGLKALEGRIETVFAGEIEPALFYPNPNYLQVLPPATPKVSGNQVREVTKLWASRLGPDGTVRQPIRDAAKACFESSVDLQPCAGADSLPNSPAAKAVDAELAHYNSEGRVMPIRYTTIISAGIDEQGSRSRCPEGSPRPSEAQAAFIAPLIGASGLYGNTTWTHPTGKCGDNWDGYYADGTSAHHVCLVDGWITDDMAGVICVPYTGAMWKNFGE